MIVKITLKFGALPKSYDLDGFDAIDHFREAIMDARTLEENMEKVKSALQYMVEHPDVPAVKLIEMIWGKAFIEPTTHKNLREKMYSVPCMNLYEKI